MHTIASLLAGKPPLIPVLAIERVDDSEPLLEALESAGIAAIEITLRTKAALQVIERMAKRAKTAVIGAGTLTRPGQVGQVTDAGAAFAVSPALTAALAEAANGGAIPFLPGVASPSEVLVARELGFREMKFFPADLMGGAAWLNHVFPLYPDVTFCPTGGISDSNVGAILSRKNVFATGGVWLAAPDLIRDRQWGTIATRARASIQIAGNA
jgi:2-dehydro-3-deoxyphosphogluconate aldolase/(4S)-4-hydroxy-2-oxoglutarate aldolase